MVLACIGDADDEVGSSARDPDSDTGKVPLLESCEDPPSSIKSQEAEVAGQALASEAALEPEYAFVPVR